MKISSRDIRYILVFIAISTIVTSTMSYKAFNPAPSERFFSMWVLGPKGMVANYFPEDNPDLQVGEEVNWTLGVHNHMGSTQYVVIRAKLLNSTLEAADELNSRPSPVTPLIESTRVVLDNETWYVPFSWRILNVTPTDGALIVSGLLINEITFSGEVAEAVGGINYRFVFELWFYNYETDNLAFSWRSDGIQRTAWTQLWFNVTAPASTWSKGSKRLPSLSVQTGFDPLESVVNDVQYDSGEY